MLGQPKCCNIVYSICVYVLRQYISILGDFSLWAFCLPLWFVCIQPFHSIALKPFPWVHLITSRRRSWIGSWQVVLALGENLWKNFFQNPLTIYLRHSNYFNKKLLFEVYYAIHQILLWNLKESTIGVSNFCSKHLNCRSVENFQYFWHGILFISYEY